LVKKKRGRKPLSEFIFDQLLLYYLWLLTLGLVFSSFFTFAKFYWKIKKTIIGRVAFFVSICFLLWGVAIAVLAIPSVAEIQVYITIFLVIASFAGIAGIFAAHHEALISNILTPTGLAKHRFPHLTNVFSCFALVIALIGIIRFAVNNPVLNALMEGMSVMTGLGFVFLAGPLVALVRPKRFQKLVYLGACVSFIVAIVALIGHWLVIPILYAPLPGGGTSVSTALGLIISSIGLAITFQKDLRVKIAKLTLSIIILLISILAILGYITQLPVLYSSSSLATLSIPTAICFVFIGATLFVNSWRNL
jgi:hypothetical protein